VDYDPNGIAYSYTPVLVEDGRAVYNGQRFTAQGFVVPVG